VVDVRPRGDEVGISNDAFGRVELIRTGRRRLEVLQVGRQDAWWTAVELDHDSLFG